MIVDFQHHFTPRELIKEDPGDRLILHYDAQGAPSYTIHSLLYDLDEHVRMMDLAGIDAAWLTSAQGMCADADTSRFVNDKAKKAERDYPGRFIGAAHAHPLGGAPAIKELNRCRHELGFQGVVITSETDGLFLDNPKFEPFWAEAARLGMFVFVHPALKLNFSQQFDAFDTAGFAGAISSVKTALVEIPASRIVFATDYPQEIRAREAARDFVRDIRALGQDGEDILSGNVGKLLKQPATAA